MHEGWTRTTLEQATSINPTERVAKGVALNFIGMADMSDQYGGVKGFSVRSGASGMKFRSGDTLVARITPCLENKKIGMVPDWLGDDVCQGSTEFIVARALNDVLDTRFLAYLLQSDAFMDYAVPLMRGTTGRQRLDASYVKTFPFLRPPMSEQKRIVDLMMAVDQAVEAADAEMEATKSLLASLRAAHFGHQDQAAVLTDFADVTIGKQKNSHGNSEAPAPYLRAANLSGGVLNIDDLSHMPFTTTERRRMSVEPGDVLIVEGGGGYGHSAMWEGSDHEFVGIQNSILRLRATVGVASPWYLLHWSKWARDSGLFEKSMTSTTIPHLSLSRVQKMFIPALDLEAQERVAAPMTAAVTLHREIEIHADSLRSLRVQLLSSLLSGHHRIPDSYDELLNVQSELVSA